MDDFGRKREKVGEEDNIGFSTVERFILYLLLSSYLFVISVFYTSNLSLAAILLVQNSCNFLKPGILNSSSLRPFL